MDSFASFQAQELLLKRGSRVIWEESAWTLQGPCAILGANGSGKSSTLSLLAGQIAPDAGELTFQVEGRIISHEEWMTSVSLAAPWVDFPRHLTLEEMLRFHGTFRVSRQNDLSWRSLLDTSGLTVGSTVPVGQWSSGQRQRLSLVLALGTKTSAVLLDEPTSNLDSEGIRWFQGVLAAVSAQTTTIVATNDLDKEAPKTASTLTI